MGAVKDWRRFEIGQCVEGELTHMGEVGLKRLSAGRRARAACRTRSVETSRRGRERGRPRWHHR